MKLRKDLLIKPQLHSVEDEKMERHANWFELLFDLIFVAAISQLTLNLSNDYSFITFFEYIPLFFVVWWGWLGHTFYLSRFGTDDVLHKFFTMAQMVVVATLIVNIKNALTTTGSAFAISYAILRFMLVAEYIWAGKSIPEVLPLTKHYSIGYGAAAILWLISAFIPPPWRFVVWGIALMVDVLTPLTAGKIHIKFPPHPTHLPERFGLFIIILIGEAIVTVVYNVSYLGLNLYTGLVGLMGLIIAFSIWWGYFEESRGAESRIQQKGDQIGRYNLWLYAHFPLLMGIVGTVAGVKHVLSHLFGSSLSQSEAWLLSISLGIAFISLSLIFISSFKWSECLNRILLTFRAPYYILIVLVIGSGFVGSYLSAPLFLFILTLMCIVKVVLTLREPPPQVC